MLSMLRKDGLMIVNWPKRVVKIKIKKYIFLCLNESRKTFVVFYFINICLITNKVRNRTFRSSEMLHPVVWSPVPIVTIYLSTRYEVPVDWNRKHHRCKNPKSRQLHNSLNQQTLTFIFQIKHETYFKIVF